MDATGRSRLIAGGQLVLGFGLLLLIFWGMFSLVPAALQSRATAFDLAVATALRDFGSERLDRAFVEITYLGARLVGGLVILSVTPFLWMMRQRRTALFLWTGYLGSILVSIVLKSLFTRVRPDPAYWRIDYATDWSFPSGHSINAVVVYGGLFLAIRYLRPGRTVRAVALVLAALAILLIGVSRIYLGVHYPMDVLAGYAAGAIWLAMCAMVFRLW